MIENEWIIVATSFGVINSVFIVNEENNKFAIYTTGRYEDPETVEEIIF